MIFPSASGCLAIASVAFEVASPIPIPAPIPVNAAIPAPIAINQFMMFSPLPFLFQFFCECVYSMLSLMKSDVKNTNT